jgi:hypothetical protein
MPKPRKSGSASLLQAELAKLERAQRALVKEGLELPPLDIPKTKRTTQKQIELVKREIEQLKRTKHDILAAFKEEQAARQILDKANATPAGIPDDAIGLGRPADPVREAYARERARIKAMIKLYARHGYDISAVLPERADFPSPADVSELKEITAAAVRQAYNIEEWWNPQANLIPGRHEATVKQEHTGKTRKKIERPEPTPEIVAKIKEIAGISDVEPGEPSEDIKSKIHPTVEGIFEKAPEQEQPIEAAPELEVVFSSFMSQIREGLRKEIDVIGVNSKYSTALLSLMQQAHEKAKESLNAYHYFEKLITAKEEIEDLIDAVVNPSRDAQEASEAFVKLYEIITGFDDEIGVLASSPDISEIKEAYDIAQYHIEQYNF